MPACTEISAWTIVSMTRKCHIHGIYIPAHGIARERHCFSENMSMEFLLYTDSFIFYFRQEILLAMLNDSKYDPSIKPNFEKGMLFCAIYFSFKLLPPLLQGAQWLSGRVLDSRPKGRGIEPHRRHCVVVLEQDTFILA